MEVKEAKKHRSSLFSTAGGASVVISEEAQSYAVKLLDTSNEYATIPKKKSICDTFDTEKENLHHKSPCQPNNRVIGSGCDDAAALAPTTGKRKSSLFSTASGSDVTVSEESIYNADKLLGSSSFSSSSSPGTTTAPLKQAPSSSGIKTNNYYKPCKIFGVSTGYTTILNGMRPLPVTKSDPALPDLVAFNSPLLPSPPLATRVALTTPRIDRASLILEEQFSARPTSTPHRFLLVPVPISTEDMRRSTLEERLKITSSNASLVAFDHSPAGLSVGTKEKGRDNDALVQCVLRHIDGGEALSADTHLWASMQLRWVVWTLASIERRQPCYLGRLLSQDNVFNVVRYRLNMYLQHSDTRSASHTNHKLAVAPSLSSSTASVRASVPFEKVGRVIKKKTYQTPARFAKRGSQSPLQRCADIAALIWPLVLCVSIDLGTDSGTGGSETSSSSLSLSSYAGEKGDTLTQGQIQVTDGWWWSFAKLDSTLRELVRIGKLRDGTKIVVFQCTFSVDGSRVTACLSANCVRKAISSAPLGFVRPAFLSQGISAPSVKVGGGPIYAMRGRIVRVGEVMSRFVFSVFTQGRQLIIILSQLEARRLRDNHEAQHNHVMESLLNSAKLNQRAILVYMGVDDWIIDAMDCRENGHDCHLEPDRERQLERVCNQMPDVHRRMLEEIMASRPDVPSWKESKHQDVLMRCSRSGVLFWLRHTVIGDGEHSSIGMEVGSEATITNLKAVRSIGNFQLFLTSSNSTTKLISHNKSSGGKGEGSRQSNKRGVGHVIGTGAADIPSAINGDLRMVATSPRSWPMEASFKGTVVGWDRVPLDGGLAVELTVQIVDRSRVMANITMFVPTALESYKEQCMPWLGIGRVVTVTQALCKSFDRAYDIMNCDRYDRTCFKLIEAADGGEGDNGGDEDYGGNNSPIELANLSAKVIEEERNRYVALCQGKTTFDCSAPVGRSESTQHKFAYSVSIAFLGRLDHTVGGGCTVVIRMGHSGSCVTMEVPESTLSSADVAAELCNSAKTDTYGFSLSPWDIVYSEVFDFNPDADDMDMRNKVLSLTKTKKETGSRQRATFAPQLFVESSFDNRRASI